MKVAVIGAAGRMGGWFTRYFIGKGFETVVYDIDREGLRKTAEKYHVDMADNLKGAVADADVTLVAVSLAATAKVVSDVLKKVKRRAAVVEIASLKKDIVRHLKTTGRKDVVVISLHPMFGHGAKSLSSQRMVVVAVKDVEREATAARTLFPEAEVITVTAEEHDETMSTVLALTHFTNFIFASALPWRTIEKIRRLSGTSFNLQITLAESILHDDPGLLATIQIDNRYTAKYLDRFVKESEVLRRLVAEKDKQKMVRKIKTLSAKMKSDPQHKQSYRKMYEIMDILLD